MTRADPLYTPLTVGAYTLQHRIAMAPMSRSRATLDHLPTPVMAKYYGQRASQPGTLLISEGTFISPGGAGFPRIAGIWSPEQIEAWKPITKAVHSHNSFLFIQIAHIGRLAWEAGLKAIDPALKVVGPSPIAGPSDFGKEFTGGASPITPNELTIPEIKDIVQEYVQASKNAIEAGADGVELHSANGFLLSQFLSPHVNKRTDIYGGSIDARSRFVLEVIDAVSEAIGADKVGIRLSPFLSLGGITFDGSPVPQFSHLINELEQRAIKDPKKRLAYIHFFDPALPAPSQPEPSKDVADSAKDLSLEEKKPVTIHNANIFRSVWSGVILKCGGYELAEAEKEVQEDDKVVIVMGRPFIANPDLIKRYQTGAELAAFDFTKFYFGAHAPEEGYTDYPFLGEAKVASSA